MDDARDAEAVSACKSDDEVEDDDADSFGFESPSRPVSPELGFVSEFTPFEDLSRRVAENYKSNLPRRSGSDRQRKFFKGKASKAAVEDPVDVEKVLKLISDKSARVETSKNYGKSAVKTYGNRRKSSFGQSVESFGLPDDPIVTSAALNDSSDICIDLDDDEYQDNWVLDDYKMEKREIKDESGRKSRIACGVYNPYYREKNDFFSYSNQRLGIAVGKFQAGIDSMPTPSNHITKMIKIDYDKPNLKKPVVQSVETLNIRPQPVSNDIHDVPMRTGLKFLPKPQPAVTTPKLSTFDAKSRANSEHHESKVESLEPNAADVTIELFSTKKMSQNVSPPIVKILVAEPKPGLKTPSMEQTARCVDMDDDVMEVVDLVDDCRPAEKLRELKTPNRPPIEPDVTIEIEPNKTSLQLEEEKNVKGSKSLAKTENTESGIKPQKAQSPVLIIDLDPTKASEQFQKVDLTQESPKSLKSEITNKQVSHRAELDMSQNKTESIAAELATSIGSSFNTERTKPTFQIKTHELKTVTALETSEPDTVDLVEHLFVTSDIAKTSIVETRSSSRLVKSQPEVITPKRDVDSKSPVKAEHNTPALKSQEPKLVESPSTSRSTESPSSEPVSDAPVTVKTDAVEIKSRRSRSVKSQPELTAPKRGGSDTKSPVKEKTADVSEVKLQESKSSGLTLESPSTVRSTEKKPRDLEPVIDITSESPVSVETGGAETKSRRSRSRKSQPEVVAPKRDADTKSSLKGENADVSEVQEFKSPGLTIESPPAISGAKQKPRDPELLIDITSESPVTIKTGGVETRIRRSRLVKSQPELVAPKRDVDTKLPVEEKIADVSEVKLQESKFSGLTLESPLTIHNTEKKPCDLNPVVDITSESPITVETGGAETKSRSRSRKSQPEVVALKRDADTKSPVKEKTADVSEVKLQESKSSGLAVESPSTTRSTRKKPRDLEPFVDITSESTVTVKIGGMETKSRRSRPVKTQPEFVEPKRGARSPVKKEKAATVEVRFQDSKTSAELPVELSPTNRNAQEKSRNLEPFVDISPQSSVIVMPDAVAVETKSRRSRSVKSRNQNQSKFDSPKRGADTKTPVKEERANTLGMRLQKFSELPVESPSAIRGTRKKPLKSEPVSDIPPESPAVLKTDAVEIKSRRSRSVKSQPELGALKRDVGAKSPVKEETARVILHESISFGVASETIRSTKKKPGSSKPASDFPPESSPIVKMDAETMKPDDPNTVKTKSRRSRHLKSQSEFVAPKRGADAKSPVKEERAGCKSSELGSVELSSSVTGSRKKPRHSEPVLDILPEPPVIPTDAAETKSRRSRSKKLLPELVAPRGGADTKSPIKHAVQTKLQESHEAIVELPTAGHNAKKQPVADISPVEPRAKNDSPNVVRQHLVTETVKPVPTKRRSRNVGIDDDVIEVINLTEDCEDQKKICRRSESENRSSVSQNVIEIAEPIDELHVKPSSTATRKKNLIPKASAEKPDTGMKTKPETEDLDEVCLSDRLKDATELEMEELALKAARQQETLKIEAENGMRLSVRLEKMSADVTVTLSSPPLKRPRGRPKLSESKQDSKLSVNSDHESSKRNDLMTTEEEGSHLLSNPYGEEERDAVLQEQIPAKRGRGRPRKLPKISFETVDLTGKVKSNDVTKIETADNSCSVNEPKKVQEEQSSSKQPSVISKLPSKMSIKNDETDPVAEPNQISSSPDKSAKEKRRSGSFWKIRLKSTEIETDELAQASVDIDDLPLSVWLESSNASDKDDSMKKRRSKSKRHVKQETDFFSTSAPDVSAKVSPRKKSRAKSGLTAFPLTTKIDARKKSRAKENVKIPTVDQEYLETLRLDSSVSRSNDGRFMKKARRSHKRINPANIKHKIMMQKELMVILKPLNVTLVKQLTPNKRTLSIQKNDTKAMVGSPVTKELVPNPVNATQHRNNKSKNRLLSTETTDFQVGDIAWAKLGSFPFWPCMITKDPFMNSHKKTIAKLRSRMQYHVRFLGDNGRRAWVGKHYVMLYCERDDLERLASKLQARFKKKGLRISVVPSKLSSKWKSGVEEAESLKVKSLEERLAHDFEPRKMKNKQEPHSSTKSEAILNGDTSRDEGNNSKKRKISAEFVPAKRPRIKSPDKQLDDPALEERATAASEELVDSRIVDKAVARTMSTRRSRRESLTRSADDLAKEPCAPYSSATARNKHLVVEGSNASDTDSKLSDISSVPTSLESQAALFKRNHLFKGVSRDKVCQICEKPGDVVTCHGPCSGTYHRDCAVEAIVAGASATVGTEEKEGGDDEYGGKKEEGQLSDDAKVEIFTVLSQVESSVVELIPTPGLKDMTLAEKIDYRMRQIMKKFDYGASYTCGTAATDPVGEDYVLSKPAQVKREKTKSTLSSPKKQKDMMEIIKHVTADNISYKCIKKKVPKTSKPAAVVVNSCNSYSSSTTTAAAATTSTAVTTTTPATAAITPTTVTTTSTSNTASTEFRCKWCTNGVLPVCHACSQETDKDGSAFRQRCSLPKCGKYYHPECLKVWPQTQWSIINTTQEEDETYSTFVCPSHVCHTCFSEDPRPGTQHCITKAAKCVRCPATYHSLNHCVPAGTQLLSSGQIVCPRHYVSQPHPCNANWCFICSKGGDLICCERCPTSVHAECMPAGPEDPAAADIYYCEDCQSGRLPLYDEIVWVKMGRFRWWPAVILFPNEVPESVRKSKHEAGEFVAKFFGTYNHFWVHRGNVFLFQEGDKGGNSCSSKSGLDTNFNKAIEEAAVAHQLKRQFKINHLAGKRSHLKPPPYIKIKSNRPLGNVRMVDHNISNTTSCECDPSQPHPCGPDSDCLNRLLLTECNPEVCPAGERCKNQCFEKREYPPLAPYKTESRGWGLKTLAPLRKGQFVIEYVGEILDIDEYRRRVKKMHERKEENYYFLTIDNMRMLDAGPKGNLARFMNHSCQPNCETQKWTVNSDTRVGLFAKTDIPVDTELTFNYNLECIGKEKKECNCGAETCSGFIGVKVKGEAKVSRKKKKKIVEIPDVVLNPCFACKKIDGEVGACNNKMCTKFYHLQCAALTSWPKGNKWVCSWHNCNFCLKRTIRCCVECTNSYCPPHAEGNVRYDRLLGFICRDHDPLNKPSLASIQPAVAFNGKKVKNGKTATPDLAVMSGRRSLSTRDKKKKLESTSALNFDENVVTSTPVKRPRDESMHSESEKNKNNNSPKKRKTEVPTANASFRSIITTRRKAKELELDQTVPKSDSSVKKRSRIRFENTL